MVKIDEIKQYIARFEKAETTEQIEKGVHVFLQNHVEWMRAT